MLKILDFLRFFDFQKKSTFFFFGGEKNIFFEVEIFFSYSFDVKNCVLSIYDVSGSFRALFGVVVYDSLLVV